MLIDRALIKTMITCIVWSLTLSMRITQGSAHPELHEESRAELAYQLAQDATHRGHIAKAKILLMNAMNKHPSHLPYLKALYQLQKNHEPENLSAITELISLFELSLYQLDPQDIDSALSDLEALNQSRDALLTQRASPQRARLDLSLAELLKLELKSHKNADDLISAKLRRLAEVFKMSTSLGLKENDRRQVKDQMRALNHLKRLIGLSRELQRYVALLTKVSDYHAPRARARVQMITQTLNLIYSEDIEAVPHALREVVEARLTTAEAALAEARYQVSKAPYTEIITAYNRFVHAYNKALERKAEAQGAITLGITALKVAQAHVAQLSDTNLLTKVKEYMEHTQTYLQTLQALQRDIYNKWAAGVCLTVREKLDQETSLNDAEAVSIFYSSKIYAVDLRLISPEVGAVYHQVIRELIEELPSSQALGLQKSLMTGTKSRLEDH